MRTSASSFQSGSQAHVVTSCLTQRGFSFLEMIIVMGILAVLMGMTVGVLTGTGAETALRQSQAILEESAYKVQSASIGGGRRSTLLVQMRETSDGNQVMQVGSLIAAPVLTHQFELLDSASGDVPVKVLGGVTLASGQGYHGSGGKFVRGSALELPSMTRFAMTEGVQIDVRIQPEPGAQEMVIVSAKDRAYRLSLHRKSNSSAYSVRLSLKLFMEGQDWRNGNPESRNYETELPAVRAGAGWHRIQAGFDGLEARIRVNGIEYELGDGKRKSRRRDASLDDSQREALRTIAVPQRGAVQLFISDTSNSFIGIMDALHVSGVFRSQESQRDLPAELELLTGEMPVRVVYSNGVLDPDIHRNDVVLQFRDPNSPSDLPIELRLGVNGTIEASLVNIVKSATRGSSE